MPSTDRKFYIGFSEDVLRRLEDYNEGKVPSTKTRRPFKLLHYEAHLSRKDALRREGYFKATKGRYMLNQILRESLASIE